ncbi:MAG: hypothetical protein SXV54_25280 [Chloroflexota bacterium]|nr:hypothetical protein [Chloroflexota bacterium]
MRTRRITRMTIAAATAIVASLVLVTALASAQAALVDSPPRVQKMIGLLPLGPYLDGEQDNFAKVSLRTTTADLALSPTAIFTLAGRVFAGEVGDETDPLPAVIVSVYGANNPHPDPGTFILSTTTDAAGWYGLVVSDTYEFYRILETDPDGYVSVGATTVSGTVRTSNWIEYELPLEGKVLTGNKFWDKLQWAKWADDVPWTPDLRITAETSDTIEVVDVVTTLPYESLELVEEWNTAHLALLDYQIEPAGSLVFTDTGMLTWQLPEGGSVFTLTKWFHVEPCTWTTTILLETLSKGAEPLEERPVHIEKQPPVLWINSAYDPEVYPGEVATFTLGYGNDGGFENDVWVWNEFPPEAPFVWSDPPADVNDNNGLWVGWEVGDLATNDSGEIWVGVAITEGIPSSATIEIRDWIYDHLDEEWGSTVITLHVQEPPPVGWGKLVNGVEWHPDLVVTTETSDTIEVVDVVDSSQPFDLVELWNPGELALLEYEVTAGEIFTDDGVLRWSMPQAPPGVMTLTKRFHVEPCTWEVTLLGERLEIAGVPEPLERFVHIVKHPPELWIDSVYEPGVFVGEPATFALRYGNGGGREFGAWIRNEFPEVARFVESTPPPTREDTDNGLWAEWDLESLEMGQEESITVTVGIATELPPSTTIEIWDGIFNHAGELVGETDTFFHVPFPPVTFPEGDWPWYAQEEITVDPEPPVAGRPTHLCAEVVNHDSTKPHTVTLEFSVANFGIGVPFTPVGVTDLVVPAGSLAKGCVVWVPPVPDHWCIQVRLMGERFPRMISQRNVDVDEPLTPGTPHSRSFPVGNPFDHPVTITLGLIPHLPEWGLELSADVLPNVEPGLTRMVTLTVTPPAEMPSDGHPIVDVEAYVEGKLIGGFRKIFRPPVILHRFPDPPYAEREISIHPYPPLVGEPTEICVELYNPTSFTQTVEVQFSWANFGIGLPFTPINGPRVVTLPPHSVVNECIHWIPPVSGHVCLQVELGMDGYALQRSQRNLDVAEPLVHATPDSISFPVGNTSERAVTITLGLIPHLPEWGLELSEDVLPNVEPGLTRMVTLTVTPPADFPPDGHPIVDVEAYVEGKLIGGFRKVFRPPVPLHPFPDPSYAEREIKVHPYPPLAGEPTQVCVELRNPMPTPQDVMVQFSWAHFGIGLPFTPINGLRHVHLPPYSIVNECIHWVPPVSGHVCLQVELFIEGHEPQRSQRNIDVDEPLIPGQPHTLPFPVGNPTAHPVTITLGLIHHLPNWEIHLSEDVLPNMDEGEHRTISLTVVPPPGVPLPEDDTPIVDVEAYAEHELIGGFRKIHRPPVPLHPFPDPFYAEREISVQPYPPLAGEPTQVCVELRNPTSTPQDVMVQFSWANFGIGLPFTPINGLRHVHLPPYSIVNECIHWIPPVSGHVCLQVELFIEGHEPQRSQRNIDVDEPLIPGEPHARHFRVGNPFGHPVTITLGLIHHLPDWEIELSPDVLPNVPPGGAEQVLLTVIPPPDEPLPPDGDPIVDVEAFVDGELIGGFRKVFRPPVPIHRPQDPIYAESEIFVHPYPPRIFEPTELAVEIRNPTDDHQNVTVTFSVASFGIGLPFTPVDTLVVHVPPHGMAWPHTIWVPPHGGLWCIQVEIEIPGQDEVFFSRLNLDVGEPLEPNVPHSRPFHVGSWPHTEPVTITLGLIPHLPGWGLELSEDVLPDVGPGEVRVVTLTVTPPDDLPKDGAPIVDVEAFVEGELLGGFRKLFRPPVPIHRPKDPVYAESEIGVDPYPVIPGQPAKLSVEVFNPTDEDRIVTATFSVAPFGIGLPFSITHIAPNPIPIFVPAHGAARGHVIWEPPSWHGKFCVQVELEMEGHEKVWSRRNIDVGEPLRRGEPHSLIFPVGAWPYTQPVTISLGLINHQERWDMSLSDDTLVGVSPGQPVSVTLTVTPSNGTLRLGSGEIVADVEAYVEGELLGGFRKLDVPPIPLHKPHEKTYAETELSIDPDPPQLNKDARVSAVMQNNGATTSTITLEFGWARFGVGIPFTTTGMSPYTRSMTLGPAMTDTASVTWTPSFSGSHCVIVKLIDPEGNREDIVSQRNVRVVERPPCGETKTYTFTVYNDSPFSVTVDIGLITFNVPQDWEVTVVPSGTLELGPYSEGVVTVIVQIPCPLLLQTRYALQKMYTMQQQAGSVAIIDVEGYIDGELKGGIEIQFQTATVEEQPVVYLPVVLKDY